VTVTNCSFCHNQWSSINRHHHLAKSQQDSGYSVLQLADWNQLEPVTCWVTATDFARRTLKMVECQQSQYMCTTPCWMLFIGRQDTTPISTMNIKYRVWEKIARGFGKYEVNQKDRGYCVSQHTSKLTTVLTAILARLL